jgi:diguanylate cyclase (GGDEF)-like protein/PAS domain S-box-containing protein
MKRTPQLTPEELNDIVMRVTNQVTAMLAYWNTDKICLFANDAYQDWFGKSGKEVMGMTMQELLGPLYEKNLPYITAAMNGERQVFERAIPTPSGEIRHSIATYTPDIVDGKVRGMIVHVADVTPLKKLERELQEAKATAEQLATHDFLTGLPNRVLLMDRISQAISFAKREKRSVAVITIDMDDFKEINDIYGHGEGDRLLVEVASRMKNSIRATDTVSRHGGDEFLLLAISKTDSTESITTLVERLLEKVRCPFAIKGSTIVPTVSVGIAVFPKDGSNPEELMSRSDEALYVSKNLGKDRYTFAV